MICGSPYRDSCTHKDQVFAIMARGHGSQGTTAISDRPGITQAEITLMREHNHAVEVKPRKRTAYLCHIGFFQVLP
jgi:hypothetical protein